MNIKEKKYEKKCLNRIIHTTLNPEMPGAIRLHLVPSKFSWFRSRPSVVIVNGKDIIPLKAGWTILLSIFINEVNKFKNQEISDGKLQKIIKTTVDKLRRIYPDAGRIEVKEDLLEMVNFFVAISRKEPTNVDIGQMSLGDFAKFMRAPHRMDLMISSMVKNEKWNCNQKCLHCYAANQQYAEVEELDTEEWKDIIDICKENCIPQLTFTGGEPTLRKDLVELVEYADWFVTRLNTNGVLLTKELCKKLYKASLDSVQVTLYSNDPDVHNKLVGANNFDKTVKGIKNAIDAGLNVSINTPLCSLNKDYKSTLKFAKELGIIYASASGLIVTGNATKKESITTQLTEKEITKIIEEACRYANRNGMEISFTSPGWIKEEKLRKLKLDIPSCGACLSNMAVAPNGDVMPCQSWLGEKASLGNILDVSWKKIWKSKKCKKIRKNSSKISLICPLRGGRIDDK